MQLELCENIGKLFYAIAKVDGNFTFEEYQKITHIIKRKWGEIDSTCIQLIKKTINEQQNKSSDPTKCFNDFIDFMRLHPKILSGAYKKLVLKTANGIAYAHSGINKSELILVAKLSIEFKKL